MSERLQHWKGILLELAIVTVGVLIALSFDGLREWWHERSLVREATANLISEISDNKRDIDRARQRIGEERADLQKALSWATELLMKDETAIKGVTLGTVLPQLTSASWQTAESTGALGHMKYAMVKDFARVYGLQEVYTRNRLQKLEGLAAAIGHFNNKVSDAERPPADLQDLRARLLGLLGGLWAEEQLSRDLSKSYEHVLQQYSGR